MKPSPGAEVPGVHVNLRPMPEMTDEEAHRLWLSAQHDNYVSNLQKRESTFRKLGREEEAKQCGLEMRINCWGELYEVAYERVYGRKP